MTIQGIKSELSELRTFISNEVIAEMKKDRDLDRKARDQGISARDAWGKLARDGIWKVLAGVAVLFTVIREIIASLKP